MSYRLVESTPDRVTESFGVTRKVPSMYGGSVDERHYSTRIIGHDVYRCGACRALVVQPHGDAAPSSPCGKCKAPP